MAKKRKRRTREEIEADLLRDPTYRRLKDRIDYFRRKFGDEPRRASS
jgi:hypothetical protein